MTDMAALTPEERSTITGAPLLAAMWVVAEGHSRTRSTLAVVRAYRDARGSYETELLRDLLAMPPADAIARPADPQVLRREAPSALRAALHLVRRVRSEAELAEYRRLVRFVADAAAHPLSGWSLRHRRDPATGSDNAALAAIEMVLDEDAS